MFHTLTLSPSLDYLVFAKEFMPDALNRADSARLFAGGKGINVAVMLRRLGQPARALGFLAGDTGRMLRGMLAAEGLSEEFLPLKEGATRINLKLKTPAHETELSAPSPRPDAAEIAALERQLAAIPPGDTLIAGGSLPPGLVLDAYARLLAPCAARGVRCVLDASGPALAAGLAARPWLIKPNLAELAELIGTAGLLDKTAAGQDKPSRPAGLPAQDTAPAIEALEGAMRAAQGLGARNVLASLGGWGAALLAESGEFFFQPAPAGQPVNTAGAGDSLLAGFLAGLAGGGNPPKALRLGVAAGSATAFCPWLAQAQEVERQLAALVREG